MPVLSPQGEVLGVMEALNKQIGDFDKDDEELLTLVTHLSSIILLRMQEASKHHLTVQPDKKFCFFDMQVSVFAGFRGCFWS